jgi:hypothetical protein
VQKCPRNQLTGPQGNAQVKVATSDLGFLRNATAVPNVQALKQLGQAVLDSIMPPVVQFGFELCNDESLQIQRGLRLIVSMVGDTAPTGFNAHELPLEAAFNNKLDFLASNPRTPVSRGIGAEPDRDPVRVSPPFRVLVVASEPTDMPQVNAIAETQAIVNVLDPLVKSRAIDLRFCQPPTLQQLGQMLQQEPYHVVHFIGHGDFEVVGMDPTPQPHLYFEDNAPHRRRRAVDVEQFYTVLRSGNIPLLILTACSSAAASPMFPDHYPGLAFEGMAHALVSRKQGPSAAIAMQFDLETKAAEIFSGALYEKLVTPGCPLDEAIAATRSALVAAFSAGHRSWVNPALYWRCKEGKVFEIQDVIADMTPQRREELRQIENLLNMYESALHDLAQQSPEEQAAVNNLRLQWQAKIEELTAQRGAILGDSIRLRGGVANPDGTIECALTIQLRLPSTIADVRTTISHDTDDFEFVESAAGNETPLNSVFLQSQPGQPLGVLIQNASQGLTWTSGEHELLKLKYRLKQPKAKPLFRIELTSGQAVRNGGPEQFQRLNAAVFPS